GGAASISRCFASGDVVSLSAALEGGGRGAGEMLVGFTACDVLVVLSEGETRVTAPRTAEDMLHTGLVVLEDDLLFRYVYLLGAIELGDSAALVAEIVACVCNGRAREDDGREELRALHFGSSSCVM